MTARTISGWVAAGTALVLLLGIAGSAIATSTGVVDDGTTMGPGMMGSGEMRGPGMMAHGMMAHGMVGFGASAPAPTAIPNAPEVRVEAANFSFTPTEIRLPRNAAVNVTLANAAASGVVHDLTVPGLGIHIAANAGDTRTVGLRDLAAGRYDAYCSVPAHAELGMRATVVVE